MVLTVYDDEMADAALCIECGATAVRVWGVDYGPPTILYGEDWSAPDEAIVLLRRAATHVAGGR